MILDPQLQSQILSNEIRSLRHQEWLLTTIANSYRKCGLIDKAENSAKQAAEFDQLGQCLEAELKLLS